MTTPSAMTTLEPTTMPTPIPEAGPGDARLTAVQLLQREPTVRRLHPAQDVIDGVLWYGRLVEGGLVLINSVRQALRADQLPAGLALRHADPGPSTVSREIALRGATGEATGSVAATLDGLTVFLNRHVMLPEPRTALWVGAWVLATWCCRAFRVLPDLSIRSAEQRCGKSRSLFVCDPPLWSALGVSCAMNMRH